MTDTTTPPAVCWFDLKAAPFSQGYAVREIAARLRSRVVRAGEIHDQDFAPTLLLVDLERPGYDASRSLWGDDGSSVYGLAYTLESQREVGWLVTELGRDLGERFARFVESIPPREEPPCPALAN